MLFSDTSSSSPKTLAREGGVRSPGALQLHELVVAGAHQVHVDLGLGVLGVVQVTHEAADTMPTETATTWSMMGSRPIFLALTPDHQGVVQGNPGARDRGGCACRRRR